VDEFCSFHPRHPSISDTGAELYHGTAYPTDYADDTDD